MSALYGLLCVRNEADRYLADVVRWHAAICDEVFVFDDQSTDDSVSVAALNGATVDIREDDIPSFLEHEGQFRQAAWDRFEGMYGPQIGDWVLAFDADEFFVSPVEPERDALDRLIRLARFEQAVSWRLRVDEIFDVVAGVPRRRVDGYWSDISAPRLVKYKPFGNYANRRMGCGSVPTYALGDPADARGYPHSVLHYGYARAEDRTEKHARYTGQANNGHNPAHIQSILSKPVLESITHDRIPVRS